MDSRRRRTGVFDGTSRHESATDCGKDDSIEVIAEVPIKRTVDENRHLAPERQVPGPEMLSLLWFSHGRRLDCQGIRSDSAEPVPVPRIALPWPIPRFQLGGISEGEAQVPATARPP